MSARPDGETAFSKDARHPPVREAAVYGSDYTARIRIPGQHAGNITHPSRVS